MLVKKFAQKIPRPSVIIFLQPRHFPLHVKKFISSIEDWSTILGVQQLNKRSRVGPVSDNPRAVIPGDVSKRENNCNGERFMH